MLGYHLYFRNPPEDWHQHNGINPNQRIYTIGGLRCGTNYQLYLEAFNDAGTSPPSDIVSAMTRGAGNKFCLDSTKRPFMQFKFKK